MFALILYKTSALLTSGICIAINLRTFCFLLDPVVRNIDFDNLWFSSIKRETDATVVDLMPEGTRARY